MDWSTFTAGDTLVQHLITQRDYRQALEVLAQAYQHLIVRHCTAMLGDVTQGEEVAQEIFLGAYMAMPRFRHEASIRTWLFAIARKQCHKALRNRRRRQRLEEAKRREIMQGAHREPPAVAEEPSDALLHHIRQGLETLGRDERTVLLLRYDTGLAVADMANILGCSEATVRRRLVRALHHLREVIDATPGHP